MHNATEQKPIYRVVGVRRRRRGRGGMQGKARQGYPTYQPGNKIDLHVDYDSWWIIILPSNIVGGGGGEQGTIVLYFILCELLPSTPAMTTTIITRRRPLH